MDHGEIRKFTGSLQNPSKCSLADGACLLLLFANAVATLLGDNYRHGLHAVVMMDSGEFGFRISLACPRGIFPGEES